MNILLGKGRTFGSTGVIDEKGRRSYTRYSDGIDHNGNDSVDFPRTQQGEISTVGMGGCRYNVNGGMN